MLINSQFNNKRQLTLTLVKLYPSGFIIGMKYQSNLFSISVA